MGNIYTLIIIIVVSSITFHPTLLYAQDTSALMRDADLLWEHKEKAEKVEAAIEIYKKILSVDEKHYEAYWKIARAYSSLGDRLPGTRETKKFRKEKGQEGMLYAKKALELKPNSLEGHYYYAFSLSQYSIGVGSLMTIAKGIDRKFEKHMKAACQMNRYYDNAGPLRGLGRYFFYLPWPKKDLEKSIQYLKEAIAYTPNSIRTNVYLAESYLELGEKQLARTFLTKAVETTADLKQEVDAERWKKRAEELLTSLKSSFPE
jgi:tetratricopeptide (TPR) repeat protein